MKIPNKRELQQIALNHSSDIDFKDFMNIYKKSTKEPKIITILRLIHFLFLVELSLFSTRAFSKLHFFFFSL